MAKLRNIPVWIENGRLRSVQQDVLSVVQQVKAISDRLDVWYDEWDDGFTVTETALDGTVHLVFRCEALDQRVIDRLHTADHWRGREDPEHVLPDDEDFEARVDAHNEGIHKALDERSKDQRLDVLERFGNAMRFDGRGLRAQALIRKKPNG